MRALGPLVALTGGFASSLYTFTLQRAELGEFPTTVVLKLYTPSAGGSEQAKREWHALNNLRAASYPVPQAICCEFDARPLGYPFIVMDYIPSASFWHVFEPTDAVRQDQLAKLFVGQLVALHALDPHVLESADMSTLPYGYVDHELAELRRDSANSPHTKLLEVVEWLERSKHTVPCGRPVILHRDYHPWNVLVDPAENLWVIDWDWRIGDARFDVAWTCMLMQRGDFRTFSSAVSKEYALQSECPLDGLEYFEVLTTVRWLLDVLFPAQSNVLLDAARRAAFMKFLINPVRRAQTLLRQHTGVKVNLDI
jgi:Phosphotransferase enzyme family